MSQQHIFPIAITSAVFCVNYPRRFTMSTRLLNDLTIHCMITIVTIHLDKCAIDDGLFHSKTLIFPILVEGDLLINLHSKDDTTKVAHSHTPEANNPIAYLQMAVITNLCAFAGSKAQNAVKWIWSKSIVMVHFISETIHSLIAFDVNHWI